MYNSLPVRAVLGCLAGGLAVLMFQQGMWAVLHGLAMPGIPMPEAYPMRASPPFGLPLTANFCLWGALFGIVFGIFAPIYDGISWVAGMVFGLFAALIYVLLNGKIGRAHV